MELNKIYNEGCFDTMTRMVEEGVKVDTIITSPFYNTNKKQGKSITRSHSDSSLSYARYDLHVDSMTNEEYSEFTIDLFNKYAQVLKENGTVIYNLSYGSNNTTAMNLVVADVIRNTDFTLVDVIVWKKRTAIPNNMSRNKLTRIVEFIYVFSRKSEEKTFHTNKKVVSQRQNGQSNYENIHNYIEAKNNDGANPLNKATYSTDLVYQLLDIYVPDNSIVYDSFMGTGTTAVACKNRGFYFIGSEISPNQVEYANQRLADLDGLKTIAEGTL